MKKLFLLLIIFNAKAFAADLALKSDSVQDKQEIGKNLLFNGFGCGGKNVNPELKWTDFPQETKVYAVKDKVPVEPTSSAALVGFYLNSMKLAEGTLIPIYGR